MSGNPQEEAAMAESPPPVAPQPAPAEAPKPALVLKQHGQNGHFQGRDQSQSSGGVCEASRSSAYVRKPLGRPSATRSLIVCSTVSVMVLGRNVAALKQLGRRDWREVMSDREIQGRGAGHLAARRPGGRRLADLGCGVDL